jgi:hypothetical protein
MTDERLSKCVAALVAAYPRTQVSPETLSVYLRQLRDLPIEEVEQAVGELLNGSEFFPAIAEIRVAVFERRLCLPPIGEAVQQLTRGRSKDDFHPLVWEARMAIGDSYDWRERGDAMMVAQARKVYEDLRRLRLADANRESAGLLPPPPRLELVAGDS